MTKKFVAVIGSVILLPVLSFVGWQVWHPANPAPAAAQRTSISVLEPRPGAAIDAALAVTPRLDNAASIAKVEYLLNGQSRYISYTAPFTATIDTSALPDGSYTLVARALNSAGEVARSQSQTVVIKHPAPTPTPVVSATPSPVLVSANTSTSNTPKTAAKAKKTPTPTPSTPTPTPTPTPAPTPTATPTPTPAPGGDTTAPTVPGNLAVSAPDSVSAHLTWSASTDNVAVTGYKIYRNGLLAATVGASTLSYEDTGRNPGGAYSYAVRAFDAANNISGLSAAMGLTEPAATVWTSADTVGADSGDNSAVQLGTKIRPKIDGYITGVRFYKYAGNTGTHIGRLWTGTGISLSQVNFSGETATGWQTATFDTPVYVTAGTTYIVSYFAPNGHYAATSNYFATTTHSTAYLDALANGVDGDNGVYTSDQYAVPSSSFGHTNYWVDAAFSPAVEDSQVAVSSMPRIAWEGGPSYYSHFAPASTSSYVDPNFFPIGVWFESVLSQNDVDLDKAAGLNTYVQITSNSDASLIRSNAMNLIGGPLTGSGNETVGYMLQDEADMTYGAGSDPWSGVDGWNTCIPIQDNGGKCGYTVMDHYLSTYPSDTRLRYANYGKGVTMWESNTEAAQFINNYTSATSDDMYFYTDPNLCTGESQAYLGIPTAECARAANYGTTMDRLRYLDALDGVRQPIYGFVEDGAPFTGAGATTIAPDQLAGAVMSNIIHEARGIIYFNHDFGGSCISQHVLRDSCGTAVRPKVIETNQRLTALAPVLNTQSYNYVFNHKLDTMLKSYGDSYYVFAMAKRQTPTGSYSFTLPAELAGASSVEVMFENRTLPVSAGAFTDNFAAEYSYHIYKITP